MYEKIQHMLLALQEISNYAISHNYNNGRIVGRDDLPTLYALLQETDEYLVIIMQRRRQTGRDDQMPEWFRKWNEEVYQVQPPEWFRKWNEEVYQVQPPEWFRKWNEENFIPLVHRIDAIVEANHLIDPTQNKQK